MTTAELRQTREDYLIKYYPYSMKYWKWFNYKALNNVMYIRRPGRGDNDKYNDCIMMIDTETSKKDINEVTYHKGKREITPIANHIVAFTCSIRVYNRNLVTLWGHSGSDLIESLTKIHESMSGDKTIFYCHNLAYDYVFLRKFMFKKWGFPVKVLNTKPHYPICIEFQNGIILKDSLILSQRKLEKWAKDLNVEHKKSLDNDYCEASERIPGKDYDKVIVDGEEKYKRIYWRYETLRNQNHKFTADNKEYIEHDTLAGIECIQKTMDALNKKIYSMPYTATGIPREEVRKRGSANHARDLFNRIHLDYNQYLKAKMIYHGGYTHGNRHYVDRLITGDIDMYDFSSSYPFVLLSEKFPMEKFTPLPDCDMSYILDSMDNYAFMFKLIMVRSRLKNDNIPMPALQYSKCTKVINPIVDNGRILACDYCEIYLNELDLYVINNQYKAQKHVCTEVEFAAKKYLPRWFTDYVFECYTQKTQLKGSDPVLYSIAKAKVNSLYGMLCQSSIKEDIVENYESGEYYIREDYNPEEEYEKYIQKRTSITSYAWGVWVTSAAFKNLFDMGACAGIWLYSDTDSCAGLNWNIEKLNAYNNRCKEKLLANGYGAVLHNGREYWLGVAELDSDHEFSEFKFMGAKRYAYRLKEDNKVHITVAGVPKAAGAECLSDSLDNFQPGFIFSGAKTGKLLHSYIYVDDIYIDENGNETGDSIDLNPCDYLLDSTDIYDDWQSMFEEEINIQVYEEV